MKNNVVNIEDYRQKWEEIYSHDDEYVTMKVYFNQRTCEFELFQLNDDNESIRTCLSMIDFLRFANAISDAFGKFEKK